MTSLTTALARAVGRARLGPGTNLVVTSLDHDANVTPWTTVAEETGTEVRHKYKKSGKRVHSAQSGPLAGKYGALQHITHKHFSIIRLILTVYFSSEK